MKILNQYWDLQVFQLDINDRNESYGYSIVFKDDNSKNILITGGAGLLGSRLADWIIKNTDYEVTMSKKIYVRIENIDNTDCNIISDDASGSAFTSFELVVDHFAAYAAEGLSPFIRCFNYDNNLKATARIVNECIKHDVKRLIFTSTLAVYGHGEGGIFDETSTTSTD